MHMGIRTLMRKITYPEAFDDGAGGTGCFTISICGSDGFSPMVPQKSSPILNDSFIVVVCHFVFVVLFHPEYLAKGTTLVWTLRKLSVNT
jgi:hypothetical protein